LWATGDVRLWVDLSLLLKDNTGGWKKQLLRVDSATDLTTFPAYHASILDLPMPVRAASGATHTQTGLAIRSGLLRLRIDGMDATEYAVACFFLGDPQMPSTGQPATLPRKLLQPLALLDRLRFHFDKNATVAAPQGEMMVAKK
jgi:hypothetical protein